MDPKDLINLAPPLLLGFGGVIPLLITANDQLIPANSRTICAIIFILLTWIGYWSVFMLWRLTLFNDWITFCLLGFAVVLLMLTAAGLFTDQTPPAPSGAPKNRFIRKLAALVLPALSANRFWYVSLYSLAIISLSMAAAMYVAPLKWTIVDVGFSLQTGNKVKSIVVVNDDETQEKPVNYVLRGNRALLFFSPDDFKALSAIDIYIGTGGQTSHPAEETAHKADLEQKISPSLGEKYLCNAQ